MTALRRGSALLLRSTDTGDDDKAVTLLSPEHGRFGALARHARASKRRFGSAFQPFVLFEAEWRPRNSGLAFLQSVHALEFPLGTEPGLETLGSAYLFLELAHELCPLAEPQPAFFELVLGGLRRLGIKAESAESVRLSVLWGALVLAGLAPNLDSCVHCGKKWPFSPGALAPFVGGGVCSDCAPGRGGVKLDAIAWQALQRASQGLPQPVNSVAAEDALLGWLSHHLGKPLRTAHLATRLNGELQ